MVMTSSRPYIVRALYDWIVDNDCTPYLLVDTTIAGVDVPDQFAGEDQVVLNASPMAVREMDINNDCVHFLARFGGRSFQVMLPMPAVMAIYAKENGQGMVFEAEAGTEDEIELQELQSLESGQMEIAEASDADDDPVPPPRGRPSLKVVK